MKTLILCGGRGTRAYPHTLELPKPLLEVAGRPILFHLMEIYAAQGFDEFVLAGGYKVDMLDQFAAGLGSQWSVEVLDTGEDADTGERVLACREKLDDTSFVTYGDGLGNVNLRGLLDFHRAHDGAATVTTVPLPSQYGTLVLDDGRRVVDFREKPVLHEHLINAGFFVLDQRAFDHWDSPSLERDALPSLQRAGELYAFSHPGFWKSMDTYKDALDLTAMCANGTPPWMAAPA